MRRLPLEKDDHRIGGLARKIKKVANLTDKIKANIFVLLIVAIRYEIYGSTQPTQRNQHNPSSSTTPHWETHELID
jgi:hypothetical protein